MAVDLLQPVDKILAKRWVAEPIVTWLNGERSAQSSYVTVIGGT